MSVSSSTEKNHEDSKEPGTAVRTATVTYEKRAISHVDVKQLAAEFDIVILAAGAGSLFVVSPPLSRLAFYLYSVYLSIFTLSLYLCSAHP